jgi:hypothetical protein
LRAFSVALTAGLVYLSNPNAIHAQERSQHEQREEPATEQQKLADFEDFDVFHESSFTGEHDPDNGTPESAHSIGVSFDLN